MSYMIKVSEIKGNDLPNIEKKGKIDPYVVLEYLGVKKKTEEKDNELNPTYGEVFEFDLSGRPLGPSDSISVSVMDHETFGRNRLVGSATVSLAELTQKKRSTQVNAKLVDAQKRQTSGTVSMKIEYIAPQGAEPAASGADDRQQAEGGDADGDEDLEEDEGEEGGDTGGVDEQGNPLPASSKKRKRKKRRARVHNLPDKDTEFQVRVKIIEARQLPGANISPVCRVTVAGETKQTRVKHSTNKPYFDETFFFNFTMRPNELFDELVNFEIFNSKKLRSDALLGHFHCDVGLVYNENGHALVRKWILLTSSDEEEGGKKGEGEDEAKNTPGGQAAGYLKINAVVLGPGDEIPDSMKGTDDDDNDDIQSNLLRPAGITLRPATFLVKIYRAEDIPQMDTAFFEGMKKLFKMSDGEKELVDPYVKFRFAGQKAKTDVHYANDHPEFNQELRVAFKFPSMCERMKLQIIDWDRLGNNDVIGTSYIPLSAISGSGDDGFLPSFGPCFVNFYGSTREFSDLPDEYDALNLGQGEGVAYRGRMLVEIDTRFGDHAEKPVHQIMAQELVRVQTYLRRRKFKLFATFMTASMIAEADGPVEFEVSMGNYGNKLDCSTPPMASSTPPTNPVFDGNSYYYLPWDDTKPCCDVDCHWEDINFRLRPLNVLLKIVDRLEKNMKKVEISVSAKAPAADTAALLIALLEQIIIDCRKQLPVFDPAVSGFDMNMNSVNELDLKVQEIRREELSAIIEEASKLREQATDVDEAMDEINAYLSRLKDLATEPQNSMPDVIIWMISGTKRIAYYRIPANEILFNSDNPDGCGRSCAKLLNVVMKYPGKKGKDIEDHPEVPGVVRVMLWLGLEGDKDNWTKMENSISSEGEYSVLAETYENEISVLGFGWTSKVPSRPSWSNERGDVRLNKDAFEPPSGWQWDGEWFIDPELSMTYEADNGHKTYLEDAFEVQSRYPGGNWGAASVPYTDIRGDEISHRDEIVAPENWEWTDDWRVDVNRAVDEEGFEYCVEATVGGWGPVEKTYHLCRRRRWARNRVQTVVPHKETGKKAKEAKKKAEGWEYAPVFGMKFHSKERKADLVRRRRWHRRMVLSVPGAPAPVFQMPDDDKKKPKHMISPRMFLDFEDPHKYQLRAYIYQARDILGKDSEGVSDPYAKVSFLDQSSTTITMKQTICPKWDQTLIFEEMCMYGAPKIVSDSPPTVVIELFDKDQVGKDEYLGRCIAQPVVKLQGAKPPAARLLWFPIMRGEEEAGQLLAAFELFLDEGVDLPFRPKELDGKLPVPSGIAPVMVRTGIEILCWGVRNMKKYQLSSVSSPQVEFEVDGNVMRSSVIKNTSKNPNFQNPVHFYDILMPKEELYAPPMNIRVLDNRSFGRKPLVGRHTIKSLMDYRAAPIVEAEPEAPPVQAEGSAPKKLVKSVSQVELAIEEKKKKKELVQETVDWWSKYFASNGEHDKAGDYIDKGYDLMKIHNKELEEIEDHCGLNDFVRTFHLQRGKDKDDEDNETVGEFKGLIKVYPLPPDKNMPMPKRFFSKLPPIEPIECIVRVYVVKGISLQPQDPSGKADPYLVIELGKQKISDKENRLANTIDPVFGRMFELKARIPVVKDLKVKVMDYDYLSRDDMIGQTVIDLENRVMSKYRGTVGLPKSYHTSGIFQWRDSKSPKEILENYAQSNKLPAPIFVAPDQLRFDGKDHFLKDYEEGLVIHPHLGPEDQRLALHVLNKQPLVQEHIETRSIFNPLRPNTDQGQLEMWVDVFPTYLGPPGPPLLITPRQPKEFELRVIIWNTADVKLDETSITGEQMSDIYVKGWMAGIEEKQKTDIHYRSLDGEGNFNWRFIFPFLYLPAEKVMVVREKEHFWSADETEERLPPRLLIQIWDNDKFSADDFIGSVELSVSDLPRPTKTSRKCGLHQIEASKDGKGPATLPTVDLFQMKRANGWWPLYLEEGDVKELTGKVEMTVELLPIEEAEQKPAGVARDEPNSNPKLDEPNRPATSFLWFTSPWKTLKYIIWRNYKWYIIGFLIFVILAILIVLFVYSMPGYSVKKLFGV